MFRPRLGRGLLRRTPWRPAYSTASRISDPLRILFCGSDRFSCASLQALHDEQKHNGALIRSIDVVIRPSKPIGRGNKVLKEVPIRSLAEQLQLPIHVRDTFTGWDMPTPDGDPINLIIAVSFGLFVPPRLIHASKYGGLNVHPSLLPDLRGPAPIHHALLAGRTHTGITIQTLSPKAFDEGAILLQTPPPGLPIPEACTVAQLHDLLAPIGASMLVETLRRGLHVPPYDTPTGATTITTTTSTPPHYLGGQQGHHNQQQHQQSQSGIVPPTPLQHAPKITPADRQVRWFDASSNGTDTRNNNTQHTSAAAAVALRARVLGPLWTHILPSPGGPSESKPRRVILEDVSALSVPSSSQPEPTGSKLEAGCTTGSDDDTKRPSDTGEGIVTWLQQTVPTLEKGNSDGGGSGGWETWDGKYTVDPDGEAVRVEMPDGSWVRVGRIKVEGSTSKAARNVLRQLGRRE